MASNSELELIYQFANAQVRTFPYPHFFIRDVFPADFYRDLLAHLPDDSVLKPISEVRNQKGYKERFIMDLTESHISLLPEPQKTFWMTFATGLLGNGPATVLLNRFSPFVTARFKDAPSPRFYNDGMLMKDLTNYAIGPHTDHPNKVITLLFYLPKDDSQSHLGTSVYIPKQEGFTCKGGPHYDPQFFNKVHTMPFLPNSVFVFFKTDNSFHGVEPVVDEGCKRWVLAVNINQVPDSAPTGHDKT